MVKDKKKHWNEGVFEEEYFRIHGELPWDIGHHDKNLEKVFEWDWQESLSILELGCGTGNDAIWFAKKGFDVTAVDISERVINLAYEKSSAEGISNIEYIIEDIFSFSTEKKFDIIYDRECIHNNQDDLKTLFKRLHKILKDDGKIIILSGNPNNKFFGPIYHGTPRPTPMNISTIEMSSKDLFKIKLVKEIDMEQNNSRRWGDGSLGWLFILEKKL
jgi:2-polyprenyl-3-methyl-5-hydroxy-6-metoxy-1,4-benzoquinol methylase